MSSDIARFIVKEFEQHTLRVRFHSSLDNAVALERTHRLHQRKRILYPIIFEMWDSHKVIDDEVAHNSTVTYMQLFKMEDVSMGMWVEQFNTSTPVEYLHNLKFCQFGCIEDYYTAHYQSPRQMMCMWEKLRMGRPQCCNMR